MILGDFVKAKLLTSEASTWQIRRGIYKIISVTMKSYTSFLKANRSLLFSLHSIRNKSKVIVKASRQTLPKKFAKDMSLMVGKTIEVCWGNEGGSSGQGITWQIMSRDVPFHCDLDIRPVWERRDDIPTLLTYFFGHLPLSDKERRFLSCVAWPGDLLQMQAVAQAKALYHQADLRDLCDAPEDELAIANYVASDDCGFWIGLVREKGLKESADMLADQLVAEQLRSCNGNVSFAARNMLLPPTTLYSRIHCRRKRLNAA